MDEPSRASTTDSSLLHDELERIWAENGAAYHFRSRRTCARPVGWGDRVVLLTFRPGRVKAGEFPIDLPRARVLEDVNVGPRKPARYSGNAGRDQSLSGEVRQRASV